MKDKTMENAAVNSFVVDDYKIAAVLTDQY